MGTDKPIYWEKLEDDFMEGRSVVLFLGTGIDFNAPNDKDYSWDALLNHLLQYAVIRMLPSNDSVNRFAEGMLSSARAMIKKKSEKFKEKGSLGQEDIDELREQIELDFQFPRDMKSTIVKQILGNEVYVKLIQDFLYREMPKEKLEDAGKQYVDFLSRSKQKKKSCHLFFFSLFTVADMILRHPNICAVVTQNYDQFLVDALTFLESSPKYKKFLESQKLSIRKIKPKIICDWKGQTDFNYQNLNIYHVHGFIPRYDEIQAPRDNKIVLSMDEFYEDTRNVYSWQIASQLHFLSQYTCIFCGLSLEDYTNQRLLHYVKNKHHGNLYYITAKIDKVGDSIKYSIKNKYHEKNGLIVLYDELGFDHIYQLLAELKHGNNRRLNKWERHKRKRK